MPRDFCSSFWNPFWPFFGFGFGWGFFPQRRPRPQIWQCLFLRPPVYYPLPKPPSYNAYSEPPANLKGVLLIKNINGRIDTNSNEHKTDKYYLSKREIDPVLVVRRGQAFFFDLYLNRNFDISKDAFSFIFTYAGVDNPSNSQGTLIIIPLLEYGKSPKDKWKAEIHEIKIDFVRVMITAHPRCLIGEWKMEVDTRLKSGGAVNYNYNGSIYIIFHPWCSEDQVYLQSSAEIEEYVVADTGLIGKGTNSQPENILWKYAQYEKNILECALYLIKTIGKTETGNMGDPVKIARAISAAVNSADDNGVLIGNWSTNYAGGTPPSKWMGSMKILQRYWRTRQPVKFGQCWVFAGVTTTVARAVGIPSRPVTNYSSAHDAHDGATVDFFVNEDGNVMNEMNRDSIWNFHVWNEMWMKRPDLSDSGEYDGWQAIDSTPQELSDGLTRCGPASVKAIKKGDTKKPYDSSFVYSEVNADILFWKYSGSVEPLKLLSKNTEGIGLLVSTKEAGKWQMQNITENYKYPEKSDEERGTMLKALQQSQSLFSRHYLNEEFNDIDFNFALRDDLLIGSPFSVVLLLKNKSTSKEYQVNVTLKVDCISYMGKLGDPVKKQDYVVSVPAQKEEKVQLDVSYDEYRKRMADQCAFNMSCLAKVKGTGYEYFSHDDFTVRKPEIKMKSEGEVGKEKEVNIIAFFVNPLPNPIKRGEFRFEGPDIQGQVKIELPGPVAPGAEARTSFIYTIKKDGQHVIVAKFLSSAFGDLNGFLDLKVNS